MKASEYVDKYKDRLSSGKSEEVMTAAADMLAELVVETKKLADDRHVSTDRGMLGCIRSQNQKFQAILNKLPKPCLKRSAFVQTLSDLLKMDIRL